MKSAWVVSFTLIYIFSIYATTAQNIPDESAKSTIVQRFGLDDVTIKYSRPNVKERNIWGALVPYHEVWRTGANYPTFITFTDTTIIEKTHQLPPGKYALYSIPRPNHWTIIFSRNLNLWGAFGYEQKDDVLRVNVNPTSCDFTETFTISFTEVSDNKAILLIQWEKLKVPIEMAVNIDDEVLAYIEETIASEDEPGWRIYWRGSRYLLAHGLDYNLAMEWIDNSLKIEKNWMNLWTKARLMAELDRYKDAVEYGNMALEKGIQSAGFFFYQDAYSEEIKKWETQL